MSHLNIPEKFLAILQRPGEADLDKTELTALVEAAKPAEGIIIINVQGASFMLKELTDKDYTSGIGVGAKLIYDGHGKFLRVEPRKKSKPKAKTQGTLRREAVVY